MTWPQPFTTQRTVDAGGISTFVAEVGAGEPIVFLHGNPDTHSIWATTVLGLPGFRCIAPDVPGFGKTAALTEVSLEAQADWVRATVDALGLDRVHLVIHDVGGVYGLAFATKYPARLRSLTVMNTLFFPDYRWHFWGRVWRTRILGEAAMKLTTKWLFIAEMKRGSKAIPVDYAELAFHELTPETKASVLRYYRASTPAIFEGWDERMRAAIASVPTLVLWGDADPFIGSQFADRFGVAPIHNPHGHWHMTEDPEAAASAIAAHVNHSIVPT